MSAESAPEFIHGQLSLFKFAGRLAVDTFCPDADDGFRDVIYYYNQSEKAQRPLAPVIPLIPDNVVELYPKEVA